MMAIIYDFLIVRSRNFFYLYDACSGGRDCLNSKKDFLSGKLLLFKLLPLSWVVLPSKLYKVFFCQGHRWRCLYYLFPSIIIDSQIISLLLSSKVLDSQG